MKRLATFMVLLGLVACQQLPAQEQETGDNQSSNLDETMIRRSVQTYVDAFNRSDAATVAAHWSENGEWLNPSGERFKGRVAIQESLREYFAEADGQQHLEVYEPSIRMLAPTVAVEEGTALVTRLGMPPSETSYIAIHVKQNDQWKIESVRETVIPSTPSNYEHLKELQWMIGEWVDRDDDATIETKCEWTANNSFISRSFTVRIKDQIDVAGTQVIGWDPIAKQIRAWVFDSEGGFGEGIWSRDGDRWMVKAHHVFHDGERASAIRIITPIDENTFRLEVIGREIGGEIQPNIDPVTVIRK